MRSYELMFIVIPTVTDEELEKLVVQMEGVVNGTGREVQSVERMGKKKLAYRIGKFGEGVYVLFHLKGSGDTIKEFERRLKVMDSVLRYGTVRVDENIKRVEKVKAARLKKKSKRSPGGPAEAAAPAI